MLRFPELRQIYCYDCGACALTCILAYYGIDTREDCVMKLAGTSKNGTEIAGITQVLSFYGLKYVAGSIEIEAIKEALDSKQPILITLQAYKSSDLPYVRCWDDGHYVVAIGYDDTRIYFEDPSSFKRTWLSYSELRERWHDIDADGSKIHNWGCIVKGTPKYSSKDAVHMD